MNSGLSKAYINKFIKDNKIDMSDYKIENWSCFNDFFTRKLKPGKRTPDMHPDALISPCDGYLSAYKIGPDSKFTIKNSVYTIYDLLQNEDLSMSYQDGICLIFRLTPKDYHRYIYIDNGAKGKNVFIQGKLHTVRPVAFDKVKVFKTNSREYTLLRTNNFDDVVFMEVGAMLVGKICNYHQEHNFRRGEEKGKFEFGGSTIMMLLKKDTVCINDDIYQKSANGNETRVLLGEKIGYRIN